MRQVRMTERRVRRCAHSHDQINNTRGSSRRRLTVHGGTDVILFKEIFFSRVSRAALIQTIYTNLERFYMKHSQRAGNRVH